MFGVDQREPDLRFVSTHDGLDESNLKHISDEVSFNSNWHFIKVITDIGKRHLLARRTPIVDNQTGGGSWLALYRDRT
mgnify:CR=1 FL=1|tara:strand:+ start:34 stop:267 length:234 start_codon:yes stop_codon:yes gene_type:complete